MISVLQMKNPEAQKHKAHITIKQQNLDSSQSQSNSEHILLKTGVLPGLNSKCPGQMDIWCQKFPTAFVPMPQESQFVCQGELKAVLVPLAHIHLLMSSLLCELILPSGEMNSSITSGLSSNHQTCHFLAQLKPNPGKQWRGSLNTLLLWEYPGILWVCMLRSGTFTTCLQLCTLPLASAIPSGFTDRCPL